MSEFKRVIEFYSKLLGDGVPSILPSKPLDPSKPTNHYDAATPTTSPLRLRLLPLNSRRTSHYIFVSRHIGQNRVFFWRREGDNFGMRLC